MKQLFPQAQVTIGPVIEDGFYYDFDCDHHFSTDDLQIIEAKMQEIAKQNLTVEHLELNRDKAIDIFSKMGEHYKVEIIKEIPADQKITAYQQGEFIDLCRGPHVRAPVY